MPKRPMPLFSPIFSCPLSPMIALLSPLFTIREKAPGRKPLASFSLSRYYDTTAAIEEFWRWLRLINERGRGLLRARRCAGLEQVGLNKLIDVAIENGVGIAHLDAGAVIFNHAIGMEHIGADLAAPRDIFLGL